jgi:hypothetical protein
VSDRNLTGTPTKSDTIVDNTRSYPVIYKFPQERPIYWGPNQDTKYPSTYVEPDVSLFRDKAALHIPVVVRFFIGNSNGEYAPEPPPPTSPPGPECESGDGSFIQLGYQFITEGTQQVGRSSKRGSPFPPSFPLCRACIGTSRRYRHYFAFVVQSELTEFGYPLSTEEFVSTFHITAGHSKAEAQGVLNLSAISNGNITEVLPSYPGCFQEEVVPGNSSPYPLPTGEYKSTDVVGTKADGTPLTYIEAYVTNPAPTIDSVGDFLRKAYHSLWEDPGVKGDNPKKTIFLFVGCGFFKGGVNNKISYAVALGHVTELPPEGPDVKVFNQSGSNFAPYPAVIEPPRMPPPPPP